MVAGPIRRATLASLSGLVLLVTGCGSSDARTVRVLAASSLTAPLQAVAAAFAERHPDVEVELHFAGTPRLVLQLREGAPADVFASADEVWMERVVAAGLVAGAPRTFATNRLAVVTPPGNPEGLATLADLTRPGLVVLLCGPEVPAGRYAREALARAGLALRPASDEPSVKAVVTKVALGEADAGIVYATDARGADVHGIPLPAGHDVRASYPVAALDGGSAPAEGAAFVDFLLGPEGRAVLASFGFGTP